MLGQWYALWRGIKSKENLKLVKDYSLKELKLGAKQSVRVALCKDSSVISKWYLKCLRELTPCE